VLHQRAAKVIFVDKKRLKSKSEVKANWSRKKWIRIDQNHSRKLYRPFSDDCDVNRQTEMGRYNQITLLAFPKPWGKGKELVTSRKTCAEAFAIFFML
jgi:hypothetical protein